MSTMAIMPLNVNEIVCMNVTLGFKVNRQHLTFWQLVHNGPLELTAHFAYICSSQEA